MLIINVQGIKSKDKQAELNLILVNQNPDIVFGTESHLDENYLDSEVFPLNFNVIRRDRNRYGGGVFIAYKTNLLVNEVPDATLNSENECLIAKLETTNCAPVYLASFYRPTNNNEEPLQELDRQLNLLTNNHRLPHLILAGDFNVPSIDWKNNTLGSNPQYGQRINSKMLEIADNHCLHQMVDETTRNESILDLIFTTSPDLLSKCQTVPGISDHDAVSAEYEIKACISEKEPRKVYIFNKADHKKIELDLIELQNEFYDTWRNRDVEDNWRFFKNNLLEIVNKNVPSKILKGKTDLPWLTPKIKRILRKRKLKYSRTSNSGHFFVQALVAAMERWPL